MRNLTTAAALALGLSCLSGADLLAGDTSARTGAEAGFAALRKAVADKDEATLTACLPANLVKDWPDEAAGEAKEWRTAFAARIAAGTVVSVNEEGDNALARWKTTSPGAEWELPLRFASGRWTAATPWAYCVGGEALDKVNGSSPAHVKLKARTDPDAYGPSAFSFVHVTQDPDKCKNRMDLVYCRCGQMHVRSGGLLTVVKRAKLGALAGLRRGGDWQDEIVPVKGAVYVLALKAERRHDLQVAIEITDKSDAALEFDWRVIAAGKNAPASTHSAQPLVSRDGADGTDGICAERGK